MTTEELQKPPGFFYGYIIVLVAFIIAAVVEGLMFSFGVFFEPLLTEFGWTRAITAGAFSLYSLIRIPMFILGGRLTDRFGARQVLSACGFFVGLGYLLMSQTNALWQIYLFYGVIIGIGMGLYWVPLLAIVPRWFIKRRALIIGIVTSGIGVGLLIVPPAANWLISTYGWRASYLILGGVSMVIIMISAQFLRRDPYQMGLSPFGASKVKPEDLILETRAFPVGEAILTRQFWIFCGIYFPWLFSLSVVLVHMVIHAIGLGMSPASAASLLTILGLSGILGRLGMGQLADVIGLKPVLIASLALSAVSFLWLLAAGEAWMVYLFAFIFGTAYSTFEVLESPIITRLFGLSSFGAIFGVIAAISSVGIILGPIVAGHIFDTTDSYQMAFIICVVMSFISLACAAILPLGKRGE